ncbi:MAG: Rho-binding antiterminator [Hydrogenovibrio sp.]|uniref:Rho-binding antiterminator n=1 Tax=Hydrogenovibrio sp. TaxID=2065821 RepID=UPI00286FE118|nr:Rho-binding antiterminator [Hydrogenovibrio sp.]MDR9498200.1 Rho-binding antiterminator [Hydrogenovibrio sp.]
MPIACSLYDQIEIAILRQTTVRLRFDADQTAYCGRLKDVFAKNGQEYVITQTGDTLPLQHLSGIERINPLPSELDKGSE